MVYFRIYFSGLVINLYVIAANADPINGAIINTHTCFNASPPAITAGARLLAGFTDVPVNFIPIICTNANVSPITIPATDDFFASDVTPNIVNMNTNVKIISTIIAPIMLIPTADNEPYPFDPSMLVDASNILVFDIIRYSIPIPKNAPSTCDITYPIKSFTDIFLFINIASDTAGFTWHPDMSPITYAIAIIDRPNASAIVSVPTVPSIPIAPATDAVPQPNKTSTAVPNSSQKYFFIGFTSFYLIG